MNEKELKKLNMEDEDDIVILEPDEDGEIGLHRMYDYLPYSYWRIVEILNYLNMHLRLVRAYKEGRYPGYKQHYNLHDNETGKLLREHVYLDELRKLFARWDIPLHDHDNRNYNAECFLYLVKQIAEEQQKQKILEKGEEDSGK